MAFNEGKAVKKVEGISVEEEMVLEDVERAVEEKKVKKGKEEGSPPTSAEKKKWKL